MSGLLCAVDQTVARLISSRKNLEPSLANLMPGIVDTPADVVKAVICGSLDDLQEFTTAITAIL